MSANELSVTDKKSIMLAMIRKEEPVAQIARRYGIAESTLYKWLDQFIEGGVQSLSGKRDKESKNEIIRLKKDIEERERIIGEITIANTILKKRVEGLI